jgi:predicted GNAT family acetyltransferase
MRSVVTHPLDKPIWSALTSRQSRFARGSALALRFPADMSPFIVARDGSTEAVAALAELVEEGDDASLLERAPPAPPPGIVATEAACVQMIAQRLSGGGRNRREHPIEPLGDRDAAEMLALATLTRPGPFRARTHVMGRFLGIRDGARLVAMGGERLTMDGFTEVTALCTHPDYRGRGYGEALLRAVSARISSEGGIPFLHSYTTNSGAIALYRRTGFELRANVTHAVWKRVSRAEGRRGAPQGRGE